MTSGSRATAAAHPRNPGLARIAEWAGLAVTLALAAGLRLGWPGVNSFSYDEARVSLLALQMVRQGQIPLQGISSSTAAPNFPALIWLMALPYAFTSDPLVATLLVGALGVLAVLGVWFLARRAWGPWAALAAGLILATAPFGVLYARSIWGQDLLPPIAVLWVLLGVQAVRKGGGWPLAAFVLVTGIAPQVHYAGLALVPAAAVFVLWFGLWRRWRPMLAGALGAALAAAPLAYTVLRSAQTRAAFLALLHQQAALDLGAWRKWGEIVAGANWEWLPVGPTWQWPHLFGLALVAARVLTLALAVAGLVWLLVCAWRGLRRREKSVATATVVATLGVALAAPLVFLRHSFPVFHQYEVLALPGAALAAGALAGAGKRRWTGPVVAGLALAIALLQATAVGQSLEAIRTKLWSGGLGTPLLYPRATARALQDGERALVHAYSDQTAYDADAAGFSVLLWDTPHSIVDGRSVLLLPAEGQRAHLLALFPDLPAWSMARELGLVTEEREFPRRDGEPPYLVAELDGRAPQGLLPVTPTALANGAQLVAWQAQWSGGKLRVVTCWQIVGPLQPGDYHQFNHLRNREGGEPLAVQDTALSSAAWQVGDRVVSWVEFAAPKEPGPYWLEVGMYTYPDMHRVAIAGQTGDAPAIRLAPIREVAP